MWLVWLGGGVVYLLLLGVSGATKPKGAFGWILRWS